MGIRMWGERSETGGGFLQAFPTLIAVMALLASFQPIVGMYGGVWVGRS
jgi:hypothetical protein